MKRPDGFDPKPSEPPPGRKRQTSSPKAEAAASTQATTASAASAGPGCPEVEACRIAAPGRRAGASSAVHPWCITALSAPRCRHPGRAASVRPREAQVRASGGQAVYPSGPQPEDRHRNRRRSARGADWAGFYRRVLAHPRAALHHDRRHIPHQRGRCAIGGLGPARHPAGAARLRHDHERPHGISR